MIIQVCGGGGEKKSDPVLQICSGSNVESCVLRGRGKIQYFKIHRQRNDEVMNG